MMYDFFITGSSSAIGNYFLDRISNDFPEKTFLCHYRKTKPHLFRENIEYINIDFEKVSRVDIEKLPIHCKEIIHLASKTPANYESGDCYFKPNVQIPYLIFKKLFENGAKGLFFLSSSSVYNRNIANKITELSEKTVEDEYGTSKLLFEYAASDLSKEFGVNTLGIRVPVLLTKNVKSNFLSKIKEKINLGEKIKASNPDALFNAICPDWAVYDSMCDFLKKSRKNRKIISEIKNISAGNYTSLRTIFNEFRGLDVEWVPSKREPQIIDSIFNSNFRKYCAFEETYKFLSS